MVKRADPPVMIALGYDHRRDTPQQITTHVVVITRTEIPMIIDLSIANLQPDQVRLIVERANGRNGTMATLELGKTTWIYTAKRDQKFPHFYQKSIVDRIETDQRVKREISWLKILIIVAITISSLNALRGGYDFYQTYWVDGNFWGPDHNEKVIKRLDELERRIPKAPE
jgi:glucosamine 6-phosphate synthetase-like amidotransferase/phosphosugar isomerase protein